MKILVVDDDPGIRDIVGEFLRDQNYEILEAEDGLAAIKVFEATPDIDVLVSDVMMPHMIGTELADYVTIHWPATKIILFSGYVPKTNHWPILHKPFRMKVLQDMVVAALADRSIMTAQHPV